MRIGLVGLFMLLCPPVFAQQGTPPVIRFDSVLDPLKLPANLYFGEVSGIAVNSKGHVFVLSRGNTTGPAYAAAAAQLLEFGPDGKYLREISDRGKRRARRADRGREPFRVRPDRAGDSASLCWCRAG